MLNKININPAKQMLVVYFALTVVTLAVFWQVNQCDFINFDDDVYVTENIKIQSGNTLDGLRWAFGTTDAEFWHPLTWLSLMLDYKLYNLNAGGYHLTNLILHIMSVLLLFLLFNLMTGAIWRSAFVAALFALHPLRVESVAWVAERKDVLSAFFWMLTLFLYIHYTKKPVIRRYLLVLIFFACALMSKPMVVTLPVVMILLDYWPLGRFESKQGSLILWQLREKIPLLVLSAVFSIITIYSQHSLPVEQSLTFRIINAPVSFVAYLERIFWPHDLAVFYPLVNQLPAWQVLGTTLLIIVISAAIIIAVKRLPYLFTGWFWYAISILPVIGIIPVGDPMADRYIYLPSIGIAIIVAWGVPSLIKSEEMRKIILFPAGIAVLVILSILTWQQCAYWKNSIELFSHSLQVTKNNYRVYHIRGVAYGKLDQYQRAIEDFNKAIELKPGYLTARYNRGVAYGKIGQYQRAIDEFNEAIRLNPDYAEAYDSRGVAYLLQGNNKDGCLDAQKVCAWGNCQLLEYAKGQGRCR
jgi:protein O-mannosyl-transferase